MSSGAICKHGELSRILCLERTREGLFDFDRSSINSHARFSEQQDVREGVDNQSVGGINLGEDSTKIGNTNEIVVSSIKYSNTSENRVGGETNNDTLGDEDNIDVVSHAFERLEVTAIFTRVESNISLEESSTRSNRRRSKSCRCC